MLHGYYKEYDEKGKLLVTLLYENGKVTGTDIDNSAEIDIVNRYDDAGKTDLFRTLQGGDSCWYSP